VENEPGKIFGTLERRRAGLQKTGPGIKATGTQSSLGGGVALDRGKIMMSKTSVLNPGNGFSQKKRAPSLTRFSVALTNRFSSINWSKLPGEKTEN